MSRATTAATAVDIEENTVTTPADLREHLEIRRTRAYLQEDLDRARALPPAEQAPDQIQALQELTALLDSDPTLAVRSQGVRWLELAVELARQIGPVERQAALAREHQRLNADPTLFTVERARAQARLGRIHPTAETEHAELRARLHDVLSRVRELTRPDWHTPHRRRELAQEMMPDPDQATMTLADTADHLRASVHQALAIDPELPEARRVLALAEQVQALAAAPRTCAAPGCAEPLPPADPGRVRRYCSQPCRTRARCAAANR